jgi:hypothetical protein
MEEPEAPEAITVKPTEPFSSIPTSPEVEPPMEVESEQLPENVETETPELEPTTIISIPTVGQLPEVEKIPKPPEMPQLPPADEGETEEEKDGPLAGDQTKSEP